MATLTSSFASDIISSFYTKFTTDLGTGSTLYPNNAYLQVRTIERAGGFAHLKVGEDRTPAIWMEYIAGGDDGFEVGRRHGTMFETFNVYMYAVWEPDTLEMSTRNLSDFRRYAEIATDTLMRRIIVAVDGWSAGVTDTLVGGITNGAKATVWSFVLSAIGDYKVEGRGMLRIEVAVE